MFWNPISFFDLIFRAALRSDFLVFKHTWDKLFTWIVGNCLITPNNEETSSKVYHLEKGFTDHSNPSKLWKKDSSAITKTSTIDKGFDTKVNYIRKWLNWNPESRILSASEVCFASALVYHIIPGSNFVNGKSSHVGINIYTKNYKI